MTFVIFLNSALIKNQQKTEPRFSSFVKVLQMKQFCKHRNKWQSNGATSVLYEECDITSQPKSNTFPTS